MNDTKSPSQYKVAYLLLRLGVGINMFGHGLVRLPKLNAFTQWMVTSFEKSWIPSLLVYIFAATLPFIEFIIGLLIMFGIFTYRTSIVGAILILMLLFGSSTIENWEAMSMQMIYVLLFAILISQIKYNTYSLKYDFKNRIS